MENHISNYWYVKRRFPFLYIYIFFLSKLSCGQLVQCILIDFYFYFYILTVQLFKDMAALKLQAPHIQRKAYTVVPARLLRARSGYLDGHCHSQLHWCPGCGHQHPRRVICLRGKDVNGHMFELIKTICNDRLGHTGTSFKLEEVFNVCKYHRFQEEYLIRIFSKYIFVEGYGTFHTPRFLRLIGNMFQANYERLAWTCLNLFQLNHPSGTVDRFLSGDPELLKRCKMFW